MQERIYILVMEIFEDWNPVTDLECSLGQPLEL